MDWLVTKSSCFKEQLCVDPWPGWQVQHGLLLYGGGHLLGVVVDSVLDVLLHAEGGDHDGRGIDQLVVEVCARYGSNNVDDEESDCGVYGLVFLQG